MDPKSAEDEIRSSSSTEDCGTPFKRRRLDSADSVLLGSSENSCCSIQSDQEVLDQSEKEENILESEASVEKELEPILEESRDSLLDFPAANAEMPKEITEMVQKNIELSTENFQLKEQMVHQAEEHQSTQMIVDKKIIELQDKLKSMSSSGDIDLQRIELERAKVMVEELTSEITALWEENKHLLSIVTRVDALEEKLKSLRKTAALQEEAAREEQFRETAESLKQQVLALKMKCTELTLKVRKFVEPAASREECHGVPQDSGSDGNKEVHPSSEGIPGDDPDGTEGEIELKKNLNGVIQDPGSDKMTPDVTPEDKSLSKAPVEDDPDGTIEMEQEEKTRHDVLEKNKMTPDATDEDDSPSGESVGDDADGAVESVADTEQGEINCEDVGQDLGVDKDNSDANSEEEPSSRESSTGESVVDDSNGTVESAAETKQVKQNRQDSNEDNITTDSDSEEEESLAEALERIRDEQKRRIKIGKHTYLASDAKFNKIDWKKKYESLGNNKYMCKTCEKESGNIHYLQDHIWCEHYGETFLCAYCQDHPEGFSFRSNLQYHMHKNHPKTCSCRNSL